MEPWAYESGFTTQTLIKQQIVDGTLPWSGSSADYPWLSWGPYLWSNGIKVWTNCGNGTDQGNCITLPYESERLFWECVNACADGTHPSDDDTVTCPGCVSGQTKVGNLLYNFFKTDLVAKEWFLEKPLIRSVNPVAVEYPPGNGIDRLQDKKRQGTTVLDEGATTFRIKFDKPVYDQTTGNALTTSSFEVAVTGGTAPSISSVTAIGSNNDEFDVALSSMIVPGQWTTIICKVKDANGNVIRSDPHDRVHLGFLPGDADGNKTVNTADVDEMDAVLANPSLGNVARHDINRNGSITSADRARLVELLQGTDTTQAWNNYSMPAKPQPQ